MNPKKERGEPRRRAVFLDRDGTLIKEKGYLRDPGEVELEAGAAEALRLLNRAGVPAVLITNQSGIARGTFSERDMEQVHETLHRLLAGEQARLDAVFVCPHHPQGTIPGYRRRCACRKPATGMLRKAAAALSLRLAGSYLIGDKRTDMQCAEAAGLLGVMVTTGYGQEEWAGCLRDPASAQPDLVAGSLLEAVHRVLAEERPEAAPGVAASRTPLWSCKYISQKHLMKRLADHRARGHVVVLANGVFDLFHAGHAGYLREARNQGDLLVVGVNDDASAAALKGPGRPVYPVEDRIAVLSAVACVDYCVLSRERTADRLLEAVRPDIHARGTDYTEKNGSERETVKRVGGHLRIVGPPKSGSSSRTPRTLPSRPDG